MPPEGGMYAKRADAGIKKTTPQLAHFINDSRRIDFSKVPGI
jgi:hypothetical protein